MMKRKKEKISLNNILNKSSIINTKLPLISVFMYRKKMSDHNVRLSKEI